MFYGKSSGSEGGHGSGGRLGRHERHDQMMKQQQLIEQKKKEIQARLDAERMMDETAAKVDEDDPVAGTSTSASTLPASQRCDEEADEDTKPPFKVAFSNDGSFLEQFKRIQEESMKKKKEEEEKVIKKKIKEEPVEYDDYGTPIVPIKNIRSIKIFHPERQAGSNHRSFVPDRSNNRAFENDVPAKRTFFDVPPPPPPPPGPPPARAGNQDIKPYYKQNSSAGGYQNVPPPPPPPIQLQSSPKHFGFPSPQVKALAGVVAEQGDHIEDELRSKEEEDPLLWFLHKPDSTEYRTFRAIVNEIRSDSQSRMYNQAPPPPPPPQFIEPQIKIEASVASPCNTYNNFVKSTSPSCNTMFDVKSVKSEPSSPPPRSFSYNNFVKSEPEMLTTSDTFNNTCVKIEPACSPVNENSVKVESIEPTTGIKRELSTLGVEETDQERRERKRKSRWGPQAAVEIPPIGLVTPGIVAIPGFNYGCNLMSMPVISVNPMIPGGSIMKVTRTNPMLLAYAKQAYGRIDLDEDEWKQCEEAYKMNMIFQDIARKKVKDEELVKAGKFKHDYDSDEETDGGTWEHKLRTMEMEKTKELADDLTQKAQGKHHIGDFLPPEELSKFMEKYKAVKDGQQLDESEYQEYKIQQNNIGFKMLQKMGWSSGEGLGVEKQGIIVPVDKGNAPSDKQGLGVEKPGQMNEDDDEYAAYRKRMQLAYRFRPNPLNNPRRAYY